MLARWIYLHSFAVGMRSLCRSSHKMGAIIFSCLHIDKADVQLSLLYLHVWYPTDPFSVFYPAFPLIAFPVCVSSSQSEPAADFSWTSVLAAMMIWISGTYLSLSFLFLLFHHTSISLSLCLPQLAFLYMFLSFHHPVVIQ